MQIILGTGMRSVLLAAAATMFLTVPVRAASLEAEIGGLLDSHPLIQAAKHSVQSAGETVGAARSGYLPVVRAQSDVGPNFTSSTTREGMYGKSFMRDGEYGAVTVTQHLYDGNATNASVDTALSAREASEASLRMTRQNTILEGVHAYLDVSRQLTLVRLARENEHRLQTQLHLENERVQRGSGMAVDVLSAKQRLQVAMERRIAFEGALQQALARYQQVFGHPPEVGQAERPPLPPVDLIPATLQDAIDDAQSNNPALQVAQKNVEVSQHRIETAKSGYMPTVDLVGRSDYASYANGVAGMQRDWAVLLELNWELFSGFKTEAQVAEASYDYGASKDNANETGRKVAEAVRLAWSQLATARERLSLLENAVNLAHEVFDARKKMHEAGKETMINVLDAESNITNADITYANADFDLRMAAYQLVHDMGRLEVANLDRRPPLNAPAPLAR